MSTKDQTLSPNAIRLQIGRALVNAATEIHTLRTRELNKSATRAGLEKSEVCLICGNPDRPGSCTCATLRKAEDGTHEGPKTKDCPSCGAKSVGLRQDKELVTHASGKGEGGVCNGKKVIKTVTDPSTLLFEDKDPKVLHPSDKKPKPVKKDEMSTGNVTTAPEKTRKGAVLPGTKAPKKVPAEGSGGQLVKTEPLQKDTARAIVGLGAFKKPGSMGAPKLPGMTSTKVNGMHPETAASLAAVKAPHPETTASLAALKPAPAAPVAAAAAKAAPKVDGDGADKVGNLSLPGNDAANLAADKKAAGVGFLNSLITRFRGVGNKTWAKVGGAGTTAGATRAMGARMALSEKTAKADIPAIVHGVTEAASLAGPSLVAAGLRVKNALPRGKKKDKPFGKSEFGSCLHCKKDEHGGICKTEVPPQTEGLSSLNHNHRLLTLRDLRKR